MVVDITPCGTRRISKLRLINALERLSHTALAALLLLVAYPWTTIFGNACPGTFTNGLPWRLCSARAVMYDSNNSVSRYIGKGSHNVALFTNGTFPFTPEVFVPANSEMLPTIWQVLTIRILRFLIAETVICVVRYT